MNRKKAAALDAWRGSSDKSLTDYTVHALGVAIKNTASKRGVNIRIASKRNGDTFTIPNGKDVTCYEYLTLDITAYRRNNGPLFAVVEHENLARKTEYPKDVWKLLQVDCKHRILVAYCSNMTICTKPSLEDLPGQKNISDVLKENPGKLLTLFIGNRAVKSFCDWNEVFSCSFAP